MMRAEEARNITMASNPVHGMDKIIKSIRETAQLGKSFAQFVLTKEQVARLRFLGYAFVKSNEASGLLLDGDQAVYIVSW